MAEFYRLLKLEELDAKHPGLLAQVRLWYANHSTHTQVASLLWELYNEEVSIGACANYYQLRIWQEREKDRASYRDARNRVKILLEEQKEDPACDAAKIIEAFTLDGVLAQQGQLAEQDVLKLIAELRKWKTAAGNFEIEKAKIDLDKVRVENEKKNLELKIAGYNRNVEEATDEAEKQIQSGQPITADDIKRLRERVIGPAPTAASH
jgi:hypothetical protein